MNISIPDLIASLHILWKGIAGLFVCCGFFALVTIALNKIFMLKKSSR